MWARNGGELFYMTLDGTLVVVPVERSDGVGLSWAHRSDCSRGRTTLCKSGGATTLLRTASGL